MRDVDREIDAAAREYRSANRVPREEIWAAIEPRSFPARTSRTTGELHLRRGYAWRRVAAAVALVATGVLIGALGDELAPFRGGGLPESAAGIHPPEVVAYLASADSLIRVFTIAAHGGRIRGDLEPWARELITRTRELESQRAADTTLSLLLRDLDLVLVQIAQYAGQPSQNALELSLIEDAIRARSLPSNLRAAVGRRTSTSS